MFYLRLVDKKDAKGQAEEDLANSKQELEDTQNGLAADTKYLMNLREKCKLTDTEMEQRSSRRRKIKLMKRIWSSRHPWSVRGIDAIFLIIERSKHGFVCF